jgi:hypothetical protein
LFWYSLWKIPVMFEPALSNPKKGKSMDHYSGVSQWQQLSFHLSCPLVHPKLDLWYDCSHRLVTKLKQNQDFEPWISEQAGRGPLFPQPYYFCGYAIPCWLRKVEHKNNITEKLLKIVYQPWNQDKWVDRWRSQQECGGRRKRRDMHG